MHSRHFLQGLSSRVVKAFRVSQSRNLLLLPYPSQGFFEEVACRALGLSSTDRLSASLVCGMWNEAVVSSSKGITIRSCYLLHRLAQRFAHVQSLDLGSCCDELQSKELSLAATLFPNLETLLIGHPDNPQEAILDEGFFSFARCCPDLQHISLSCLPNLSNAAISCLALSCRLRFLSLEDCPSLTDQALTAIAKCRTLEELTLKGKFNFSAQGLAVVGEHCKSLRRIHLAFRSVEVGFVLKAIARRCKQIQEITLKVGGVDLEDLTQCTSLTCLRVETVQWLSLDGAVTKVAAANKNLKELVIISSYSPLSDPVVVAVVQSCPMLEKLHIHASRLSGAAILCLMDCKTLKSLALDYFKSSGQGLAEVGLCAFDLKELSLRSGKGIRDVELQTLVQNNRKLESLDLKCCSGLSPVGFSAISHCSNLKSLNLSFTNVDDISLMAIADGIKGLKQLSLGKCESISNIGVVARFTALESLNLDQCPFVTDEGLDLVASGCSQLAHLSLASTSITDVGLHYLTNCTQLRSLIIPYCRHVEGPGLIEIVKTCAWFRYVVVSYRLQGSKAFEELKKHWCTVRLETDNLALVPFGFNLLM